MMFRGLISPIMRRTQMGLRGWVMGVLSLSLTMPVWALPSYPHMDLGQIDRRATEIVRQPEVVGLAMAIVVDGQIVMAKGYGETRRDSGHKVTPDTVFRWASLSKGVAANVMLALYESGSFKLTDRVEALSSSIDLPALAQRVNVIHLLSHRTGLPKNAYDVQIEDGMAARAARRALAGLPLICEPGTCHSYQNVAYDAVSEIIEDVMDQPFETVLKQNVFEPLGMETASVSLEGLVEQENWAKPHDRFGNVILSIKPTYYRIPAAAGINSSILDLAKWMRAQMPSVKAIPKDRLSAMQTRLVPTPEEQDYLGQNFSDLQDASYGLGWRVYNYRGHKVVGHRGGVDGYRAVMLFDPEQAAGIVLMWNSPHSRPMGLQLEFLDQLYGLPPRDWVYLDQN